MGCFGGDLGPTRAPRGAFPRGLAVVKLSADARTGRRSRGSPLAEWYPIGLAAAPPLLPPTTRLFFASKGSVCWPLLVSGAAIFASWTAFCCSANHMKSSDLWTQRHADYAGEATVPERRPRGFNRCNRPYCQQDITQCYPINIALVIQTLGQINRPMLCQVDSCG